MGRYTKKLKQSIVSQMMPPKNKSISQLAVETGIKETTLYKWEKEALFQASFIPAASQNTKSEIPRVTFHYRET
ncbi:transposase [Sporomusa sphaeroides DSM 2875]|uniref:transposase n=1 Tax=Sporomusa sphaeroides TaxID=47679 RepID=UPI00202F166F|nr:transposase [Sporomusa sphaeroides DSM 2875]